MAKHKNEMVASSKPMSPNVLYGALAALVVIVVGAAVFMNNGDLLKGALVQRGSIAESAPAQVNSSNGTATYTFYGKGFATGAKGTVYVSCNGCSASVIGYAASDLIPLTGAINIQFAGLQEGVTYGPVITVVDNVGNRYALNPSIVMPTVPRLNSGVVTMNTSNATATYTFTSNFAGSLFISCPGCTGTNSTLTYDNGRAVAGTNTITFSGLQSGVSYSPVITVLDSKAGYINLNVPSFTYSTGAKAVSPVMYKPVLR